MSNLKKKDYELIAGAIRRTHIVISMDKNKIRRQAKIAALDLLTTDLAATLAQDNPKFDEFKFKLTSGRFQD